MHAVPRPPSRVYLRFLGRSPCWNRQQPLGRVRRAAHWFSSWPRNSKNRGGERSSAWGSRAARVGARRAGRHWDKEALGCPHEDAPNNKNMLLEKGRACRSPCPLLDLCLTSGSCWTGHSSPGQGLFLLLCPESEMEGEGRSWQQEAFAAAPGTGLRLGVLGGLPALSWSIGSNNFPSHLPGQRPPLCPRSLSAAGSTQQLRHQGLHLCIHWLVLACAPRED